MYDILPDIHGQADKLTARLSQLGYEDRRGAWRHPDPMRMAIFLGDFIDRGPDNGKVIDIVRRMIDAGTARAVMGNHELNAIHFHTPDPDTGAPLREHSSKNVDQHSTFLNEFSIGTDATRDVIGWMTSLPLFLEFDGFRCVHACWEERGIRELRALTGDGRLTEDQIVQVGLEQKGIFELVEKTTKGPEADLPDGYSFTDAAGHERTEIRLQWWNGNAHTWRDIAISVPNLDQLPDEELPSSISQSIYGEDAPAVFFGHYWLRGTPTMQSHNALCLDYSAGSDGPLVAYRFEGSDQPIDLGNLLVH